MEEVGRVGVRKSRLFHRECFDLDQYILLCSVFAMSRLTLIVAATSTNGIGKGGQLPWRLPKEMSYFAKVTSAAPDGKTNAVIMGRNTWESIPPRFRPLQNRANIVISHNKHLDLYVHLRSLRSECLDTGIEHDVRSLGGKRTETPLFLRNSLDSALDLLSESPTHRAFIIGGVSLYTDTLALPPSSSDFVDRVLLTRISSPAFTDCDVHLPDFLSDKNSEGHAIWTRARHEELKEWTGLEVPQGVQTENGVEYEFQMWTRSN
jgi:dihydrofolate reductase